MFSVLFFFALNTAKSASGTQVWILSIKLK